MCIRDRPYDDPEKGKGPFVPAPPRDKLAGLQINPNSIMLPFVPKDAETDEDYGEGATPGHPDWKMAHGEGRGPQPKYHDEYNRPLKRPPWMQMFPDGTVREIPWMKEQYKNEHPELQISQVDYGKPTERDLFLQRFQGKSGTLRNHPEKIRPVILSIAERMKA